MKEGATLSLPKGWEIKILNEIAEVGAGNSAPQKKELFVNGTYPFIRTSDVGQIRTGFINSSADNLNEEGIRRLKLKKKGTILFPKSGASTFLNHRVMMEIDGYVSSHLATIKAKESFALDRYLLYFLVTIDAKDLMQDIAYPSLKISDIGAIQIPIPPLPEQQRIVSILDKAFADIDKAKANAEQNLQNAKELFESFSDTIPADKVKLGSIVTIKTGKLNANSAKEDGDYPFFTCSREVFNIDNYAFDQEAVLLAGNNASGDFNVKHYKGKFNAYQRTYVIAAKNDEMVSNKYLYYQLQKGLKEFKRIAIGANTRFLKLGMIQNLQIPLPSYSEQMKLVQTFDSLLAETQKLEAVYQKKMNDLEELKKSILEKAFAGELEIEKELAL
ncbi:MAG: restriction endonuclease subunit S [Cryomorphaceae bacterium]